jgi:dephospho-CoA kinase
VAVETAILFESGMDADVDAVVWVYASEELRLQRAMQRDGADEAAIRRRMSNQMSVGELSARATYRIDNDGTASLIAQVQQVIREINEKCMR